MRIISPVKYFFVMLFKGKLKHEAKRDFKVLTVACILNFSFAVEKLLNYLGMPLNDLFWFLVYGFIGLYLAFIAFHDYFHDVRDDHLDDTPTII